MNEQVEILNEYYTNLDYNNYKEKALEGIYNLSETVRFHNSINLSERFEILANIIQENILLFRSVCRHVDIIDTILEYFTNFSYIYIKEEISELDHVTFLMELLLTLFNMCKESAIKSFLLYPSFTDFPINVETIHSNIKSWLSSIDLEGEMIILEDSDLYAVINYLIITDDFPLYKIWVQEQVKEKFLWLVERHYSDLFTVDTFQSLEDIQLHMCHKPTIKILSIWSENIVAAKNFALSLNSHIVFINAHMDFSGGITLFPFSKMIWQIDRRRNLNEIRKEQLDSTDTEQSVNIVHISHVSEMNLASIHNLFYDGTWQEPIKGMYWKHNDNLWANATNDDIIKCYESAEKGFETWSVKSIKTRIQILSKLVPTLKLAGKLVLAAIVTRWLKFPYLFSTIQGYLVRNETVEVMQVHMPIGVIILREENENVLFFRLMQTLIAGNSVIVMFDANFCDFTLYCNMFSTCEIPPDVINLLSHEDTNKLEYKLCSAKYMYYVKTIFSKSNSMDTYIKPYKNLTLSKNIILHLK